MAIENKTQLKSYFEKGDKPTQVEFENLIDSFRHIDDGATLTSLTTNADGILVFEFSNGQKVDVQEAGLLNNIANRLIEDLVIEEGYVKYRNNQGELITQISVDHFADKISQSNFFKTAVENLIPTSHPIAYILGLQDALDQRVTIAQLNEAISASAYGIKYSWANVNERNSETGMNEFEQGVQQDTREVYRYDGNSWVLFYTLDATHHHDDRYYSKSESDAKFITEKREVSDLLTSTSTVIAASSKALKTVNDKVNNKLDKDDKAVDSDKLDGKDSSAFALSNHHHDDRYKRQYTQDFTVEGDADKYYQVVFKRGNQNRIRELNIYRSYHEQAPDSWYSATHKGGLTAEFRLNSGGWGGAQYDWKLLDLRESYTTILADAGNTNHNMAFFVMLRGGGAIYHVDSDDILDIQVVYSSSEITYEHTNTSYIVYGRNPVSSINTQNLKNHTIPTLREVLSTAGKAADSDKLDGLDSSAFVRKNLHTNNSFYGQFLIFNHTNDSNVDAISFNDTTNDFFFNADTSKSNNSANAGVHANRFCLTDKNTKLTKGSGNSLKITSPSGYIEIAPKNTSHCHFSTDRSSFYFNKALNVDSGVVRSYNEDLNLNRAGSSSARMIIANGITYSDQNLGFRNGGRIRRYSHVGGFLEGSYNTVGANSTKTNPIYTIGSSYIPSESALGNMYGIGYSHGSASFLNSTDLGVNPPSSWGLYVSADGNARIFLNATHGHGYFKGDVYANKGVFRGDITASSDKRLKTDIKKIENAVDKILQINGCTWERKDTGERQTGLIAQELRKILPEAVHGEENDTEYLSVAYGNVVGLLVEGIKEQANKLNSLEERLEKLETLLTHKN